MALSNEQIEVIRNCQKSITWFLSNFAQLKHPSAGVLPFHPFKYQKYALRCFRQHKFNIFRKCRQCFAGESMVWGPSGPKRMDQMRPGDLVYSLDRTTGLLTVVPVLEVLENGERECLEVTSETGHRSVATTDHHYFTWSGELEAGELTTADTLLEVSEPERYGVTRGSLFDRRKGKVKAIQPVGVRSVYDLRVPPHDNYVVDGVVVHNSGISKISGAYALWFSMFNSHKTTLIVSRTDLDAMKFLRENIKFSFDLLPDWMQEIWHPIKDNEHELAFPNGSSIQSLTSSPDVMRSNAASLNIIDEAAFIDKMDVLWAGGWSCARYDTLVQTADGLLKLGAMGDPKGEQWQPLSARVPGDADVQAATAYYVNGLADTIILGSELGVEFEATPRHRLRVVDDLGDYVWRRMDQLRPGDLLVSLPGQFAGRRRALSNGIEIDEDLAEIVGLYIGDGSIYRKGHRLTIVFDPQDVDARDRTLLTMDRVASRLSLRTRAYPQVGNGTLDLWINSADFINLLVCAKLDSKTHAQDAEIPELILRSDKPVLCAFLRGLFEADGWCYQTGHVMNLGMSSASKRLAEQVQTALHSLGVISRVYLQTNTEGRVGDGDCWRLDIKDAAYKVRFRDLIGFISDRKSRCLHDYISDTDGAEIDHPALVYEFASGALRAMLDGGTTRQCTDGRYWNLMRIRRVGRVRIDLVRTLAAEFNLSDRLSRYAGRGFHFDRVESLRTGRCETFDISVPEGNTYLANGLVSHNTLQHGGSAIVISTANGIGNWYWSTYTDAEAGKGVFNPIIVNWWDMDWVIEFQDSMSGEMKRIAPTDGIVDTNRLKSIEYQGEEVVLDPERYGPKWSPWLEEQYRALQEKGESWKFDQEVLAAFVGTGNTVLPKSVLNYIGTTIKPYRRVTGMWDYVHPISGHREKLDYTFGKREPEEEGLFIWSDPVVARPALYRGKECIDPGAAAHPYVMGVDIASGKAKDYHAIEIFDVVTMEQVAELLCRNLPRDFVKMIDHIGRWYNTALAVVERNNGGNIIIDELRHGLMYPRIWRKRDIDDKPKKGGANGNPIHLAEPGFFTGQASKPVLNQYMHNFLRDKEGEGYTIKSYRLHKQLNTYVRKRDRSGRDTGKTEAEDGAGNFDDLVIGCALALVGAADAIITDATSLFPTMATDGFTGIPSTVPQAELEQKFIERGGPALMMPMALTGDPSTDATIMAQLDQFTCQLGALPLGAPQTVRATSQRKPPSLPRR